MTGARHQSTADQVATKVAADGMRAGTASAVDAFTPPPWLTDKTAIGVWNRIAPELKRLNMLTLGDRDTFGRYCFHFAGFIRTIQQAPIGKEFVLVKMTNSTEKMPRLHPAVKAREIHERHLVDIEDRFGGSPLARYRLIAQQAAHPGAFGDLFGPKQPGSDAPAENPAAAAPSSPVGILGRPTAH